MTQPVLLVRADASPAIGAGHVLRCLALAEAWIEETGGTAHMIAAAPAPVLDRVRAGGIEITTPRLPAGSAADAERTLAFLRECGAVAMVTDGYAFGASFQAALQESGTPLLSIDDWAHTGSSRAQIILDQNAGVDASIYSARPRGSAVLLGPRYALLRREFRSAPAIVPDIPPCAARILVTLGGGDQQAAAMMVLESLALLRDPRLEIRVLIGPASAGGNAVRSRASTLGLNVEWVRGGSELPEIMRWAHFAISGGGTTCWELAFLGVPSLVIELADNQHAIAQALSTAGVVENAGKMSDLSREKMAELLEPLFRNVERRREQSSRGRALVDGRGAPRVAQRLASLAATGARR